jgi:hypothetical protein
MDWYYALVFNGSLFWITSAGVSVTPAPLLSGVPPADFSAITLFNSALPAGTTATFVLFQLEGATVRAVDFITGVVS